MEADPGETVRPADLRAGRPDLADASPRRRARQPRVPGWVWLVLVIVGFGLLVTSQWTRFDEREITIDAWACSDTPTAEQSWSALQEAGCRPADVDAEIVLRQSVSPVTGGTGADPLTVPSVDGEAVDLSLSVRLATPATAILLVDASTEPPTPGRAMSADTARLRWTSPFDPAESEEFVLLVGPRPDAN
jgi:hypothetical protein